MDILFAAHWRRTDRKAAATQGGPPPSGLARLLVALCVIAVVVGLLDHAARNGPAGASVTSFHDSSQQGR